MLALYLLLVVAVVLTDGKTEQPNDDIKAVQKD
jgi:hypothetical protein